MITYKGSEGIYEPVEWLGAGGNGEVWRARGPRGDVAVKVLKHRKTPADAGPRFSREIAALRRLHDVLGVLPLLDADPDPASSNRPWYAMPLAIVIQKQLGPEAQLRDICVAGGALAAALAIVHVRGVVHRDIKPDNLFWHDGRWCLGDFGLADFQGAEPLTRSDRKLGPAHYIAPEMLNDAARADGRAADVYSFGKTLWVLATGQTYPLPGPHDPSYHGAAVASFRDDQRAGPLDELLRRMTMLDPARRVSVEVVANELQILCKERPLEEPPDPAMSLHRLRNALGPHFTREEEEKREQAIATAVADRLKREVTEIANGIHAKTNLRALWYSVPKYWGYHEHLAGAQITWERKDGLRFEAGGPDFQWSLGIGAKCQLLSDGNLDIHVGYEFDRMYRGREVNSSSTPRGWDDGGQAPNGAPSCGDLVERLIQGLRDQLPATLDQFAQMIERAAD